MLRVDLISRHLAAPMIGRHYLRRWPGVVRLSLGLYCDDVAVGLIVFAEPPRETKKRYGCEVWELARLWVHDKMPRNTETWFMARSIRILKRLYPEVAMLLSYADPSAGHRGTVYKAANWIPDGRTDDERKSARCDYVDDNGKKYSRKAHVPSGVRVTRKPRISKFRFIYWLRRPASSDDFSQKRGQEEIQ